MKNDSISRQAAIATIEHYLKHPPKNHSQLFIQGMDDAYYRTLSILRALPSAQPEIIRCKDCTYWMPHVQLGYDEDNDEYHDYCARLIPDDEYYAFTRDADDFCSRGVRRTDEPD